jgi:hypothetical protein
MLKMATRESSSYTDYLIKWENHLRHNSWNKFIRDVARRNHNLKSILTIMQSMQEAFVKRQSGNLSHTSTRTSYWVIEVARYGVSLMTTDDNPEAWSLKGWRQYPWVLNENLSYRSRTNQNFRKFNWSTHSAWLRSSLRVKTWSLGEVVVYESNYLVDSVNQKEASKAWGYWGQLDLEKMEG